LKQLTPVRLLKNEFYNQVQTLEHKAASIEELTHLLGKGRSKKGMFEGDMTEGELEIGQVSGDINAIVTAKEVIDQMIAEYNMAIDLMSNSKF
jgi:enoyl-[acyl-carrier protein] reductase II